MKIRLFWVVVFALTLYIPFEEAIVNWIPVPDKIYLLLRFVSEIVIYIFLAFAVLRRLASGKKLRKTPIDLPLVAFVVSSMASIITNNSPIASSLISLRTLIRYIALYYLIVNVSVSKRQISSLLTAILIIGLIQGVLSFGQYFSPGFNALFSQTARDTGDVEIAGQTKEHFTLAKVGAVVGTFGQPATMALFLLVSLVILFAYAYRKPCGVIPPFKYLLGALIISWGAFATYKRGALLSVPFLLLFTLFYGKKNQRLIVTLGLGLALCIALVSVLLLAGQDLSTDPDTLRYTRQESFPVKDFLVQLFTADYWEKTGRSSRGWFMREASQHMLVSGKLLGYGPDEQMAREALAAADPAEFERLLTKYPGFEDTYWVAMLAYYGIVGLLLYFWMLYRLYRTSRQLIKYSRNDEYRLLGIVFCTLIILVIFYSFIERALELRAFSFYFWLLAGLVVNSYYVCRQQSLGQHASSVAVSGAI